MLMQHQCMSNMMGEFIARYKTYAHKIMIGVIQSQTNKVTTAEETREEEAY